MKIKKKRSWTRTFLPKHQPVRLRHDFKVRSPFRTFLAKFMLQFNGVPGFFFHRVFRAVSRSVVACDIDRWMSEFKTPSLSKGRLWYHYFGGSMQCACVQVREFFSPKLVLRELEDSTKTEPSTTHDMERDGVLVQWKITRRAKGVRNPNVLPLTRKELVKAVARQVLYDRERKKVLKQLTKKKFKMRGKKKVA